MPKAGFETAITASDRSKLFMPQTARLPRPAGQLYLNNYNKAVGTTFTAAEATHFSVSQQA
jgi:hypothetical protein